MIKVPTKLNMLQDVHVPTPTDNYFLYWDDATGMWKVKAVDHGELAGLADDDHSQYHTNTRGDARYLYRENVGAFTPDADYEPATKKYVDDNIGGGAYTDAEALRWALVVGG